MKTIEVNIENSTNRSTNNTQLMLSPQNILFLSLSYLKIPSQTYTYEQTYTLFYPFFHEYISKLQNLCIEEY